MPKAFDRWNVLPHGSLVEHAENLWSIDGALPNMPLRRRMTLARRANGSVVVHNAIALEDDLMKKIEAWGTVDTLVVPNGWHRLDAPLFHERYPAAKVVCPAGSRKKIEEVIAVDATYADLAADADVGFEHLDGTKLGEGVMRVRSSDGVTLVFNDAIFNVPHLPGAQGFVLKLMGSTGGPKITKVGRWFLVKDKAALRAELERLASDDLVRLVPGHGDVVEEDAAAVLRRVAASL
jgi:hypothetical protein